MPTINFDEPTFLSALNNGLGLTGGARTILLNPKRVSSYIKNKSGFQKECNEAIQQNYKALLALGIEYHNKRQLESWKKNMEYIRLFKSELVFWEGFAKKKDVDPEDPEIVYKAWHRYHDIDEMCTAIGFTKDEFVDLVFANNKLLIYFTGKI